MLHSYRHARPLAFQSQVPVLLQFQSDDPKNILTAELQAKGITQEQWEDCCKTLQDVPRLSNSDFQKAIDGLNSKYFTAVRTLAPVARKSVCAGTVSAWC